MNFTNKSSSNFENVTTLATWINTSFMTSQKMNLTDDGTPIVDFSNDPLKTALNEATRWLSISILVEVMLGLGCTVEITELKAHLKKPIGVGIAALIQFILIPLIVFGIAKASNLPKVPAVVALVTTSIPGGTLSNILAYLIKGDMALSMLMTSCSSVLAFAFIPFNLFVYGSQWLPDDTDYRHLIPYQSVLLSLILLMGAVSVGVLVSWKVPKVAKIIVLICQILLVVSVAGLAVLSGLLYRDELLRFLPLELWLMCALLPPVGYALGFLLSTVARINGNTRRTVAIETMCQNGQLGCAILKVAFPHQLIGSFFVFPLLYSAFQMVEGLLVVAFFKFKDKSPGQSPTEEKKFDLNSDSVRKLRKVSIHVIDRMRQSFARIKSEDRLPVVPGSIDELSDEQSSSKSDVISLECYKVSVDQPAPTLDDVKNSDVTQDKDCFKAQPIKGESN
ncbi:unnamed protein product [Clavelina lepadiformis]|uniref:Ileal sodium/bile acid cotransporter n=1 Tax=Clavelina lepadiformis TaxID=159417 RepID=A0ABP0G8E4_CLALP